MFPGCTLPALCLYQHTRPDDPPLSAHHNQVLQRVTVLRVVLVLASHARQDSIDRASRHVRMGLCVTSLKRILCGMGDEPLSRRSRGAGMLG